MITSFFKDLEGLGTTIRWAICLTALLVSCIALSIAVAATNDSKSQARNVCYAYQPTTHATNEANGLFHSLVTTQLNNALHRIGTKKELPSDKATVIKLQKYINKFIVVAQPNCAKVVK